MRERQLPPLDDSILPESGIVVVRSRDSAPRENLVGFFDFAPPSRPPPWAYCLLCVLAISAISSVITLAVLSGMRHDPPAPFKLLKASQCSALSPLYPAISFTAWGPACSVHQGSTYPCTSAVDCLMLSTTCAAPSVLASLICDNRDTISSQGICTLVIEGDDPWQVGGFCTENSERCAACVGPNCDSTKRPIVQCQPASVCTEGLVNGTWMCL